MRFEFSLCSLFILFLFLTPLHAEQKIICNEPLDILLVLDGSASLSTSDYNSTKYFAYKCAELFNLGDLSAHLGVLQFSGIPNLEMCLTGTPCAVTLAVQRMQQIHGRTDLAAAINAGKEEFKVHGRTDPNSRQIMIIVSDGKADAALTIAAADAAKAQGIEIQAIGVGADSNTALLNRISTSGKCLHVSAYSELVALAKTLVMDNCRVVFSGACDLTMFFTIGLLLLLCVFITLQLFLRMLPHKLTQIVFIGVTSAAALLFILNLVASAISNLPSTQNTLCIVISVFTVLTLLGAAFGVFSIMYKMQRIDSQDGVAPKGRKQYTAAQLAALSAGGSTPAALTAMRKDHDKVTAEHNPSLAPLAKRPPPLPPTAGSAGEVHNML
eukprot:gnl/Trimastix_PCT/3840.p1 GENE.gnl/Trimastix_PCT/3840~~gnl/Trimastix_PCT/3840.p1  ORF type:complete len:384 (+),score=77.08 gnl/Trimastix_PCT/3840:39-1190(+)